MNSERMIELHKADGGEELFLSVTDIKKYTGPTPGGARIFAPTLPTDGVEVNESVEHVHKLIVSARRGDKPDEEAYLDDTEGWLRHVIGELKHEAEALRKSLRDNDDVVIERDKYRRECVQLRAERDGRLDGRALACAGEMLDDCNSDCPLGLPDSISGQCFDPENRTANCRNDCKQSATCWVAYLRKQARDAQV